MENGSKKRAHVEAADDAVCGVNPEYASTKLYATREGKELWRRNNSEEWK